MRGGDLRGIGGFAVQAAEELDPSRLQAKLGEMRARRYEQLLARDAHQHFAVVEDEPSGATPIAIAPDGWSESGTAGSIHCVSSAMALVVMRDAARIS
jgi:hypothetical protein